MGCLLKETGRFIPLTNLEVLCVFDGYDPDIAATALEVAETISYEELAATIAAEVTYAEERLTRN